MNTDTTPSHWVHDIDPVLIHIYGDFGIRYYGLAYIAGFAVAYWAFRVYRRRGWSPLDGESLERVAFATILGLLVGARLGFFILYDLERIAANPASLLRVWEGGMSFHGGIIGAAIGLWWSARKANASFMHVGELITTIAPVGIFCGRMANFINGELYGKITTVPWAVIFPGSAFPGTPVEDIPARHPSQLYEAAAEGLFLLAYMQWRLRFTNALSHPGRLGGEFLILYAVGRIFCETFREPDASLILGMSRGTVYSALMIVIGAAVWAYSLRAPERVLTPPRETSPKSVLESAPSQAPVPAKKKKKKKR